ncbi:MAG: tRNA (5-methylaminomethyl-2-thiouridine)(34)-methyltransferase MnmD [Flavobacteriaceae bacterium]
MGRKIITTADGSKTIYIEEWNEHYHSKHGAVQEAYHVFIRNGLHLFTDTGIAILEMGFGTGLNALATLLEAPKQRLKIHYTGIEKYPIAKNELIQLNYAQQLGEPELASSLALMHACEWGRETPITDTFSLKKEKGDFLEMDYEGKFHLVYFDAFGPRVQPELWEEDLFHKVYRAMRPQGVLVTYSAKGSVRRAMQSVGFVVERLPGPPGKREMLRASKP